MSLRLRLLLAFVLLVSALVLLLTRWIVHDIRPQPLQATEDALAETAALLASLVEPHASAGAIDVRELRSVLDATLRRDLGARIYDHEKRSVALRIYVVDARGIVRYDSAAGADEGRDFSRWNDVFLTLRGRYGARAIRAEPKDPLTSVLYVAAPIRSGDRIVGALSVGKPVASLKRFIRDTNRKVSVAGAVAVFAALTLGLLLAEWIARPLRDLTAYALAVAQGLRPVAPRLAGREVATLGHAFESMREALEGKRYVEGYVRTLTHEIKGPLTAIRAAAELLGEEMPLDARRRFLANIRDEAERLQRLIERMLALSTLEARKTLDGVASLDLAALVREVAESFAAPAQHKGVTLNVLPTAAIPLRGDRFLLRQALANLVQNALEATPTGGHIALDCRVQDTSVSLLVSDTGPGIPAFALPRAFERFYSVPISGTCKSGTGLGLAFVREVALLHGGSASLENLTPSGARAQLTLPRTPGEGRD